MFYRRIFNFISESGAFISEFHPFISESEIATILPLTEPF
jgi:hypothetical protein